MSNIVKSDQAVLTYTKEQIELIKQQIAPRATDSELQLFLYQCQRTGLDALSRQIYAIHRSVKDGNNYAQKMTIQTSIDGFRVVAERSGSYAGQGEPEFVEQDGKIICCKVRVYRFAKDGTRYEAAVGVAYWDEYVQNTPLWTKMRHTMIAKCAEALALRKAFPQDLSGLYTSEEMSQADAEVQEAEVVSTTPAQPAPQPAASEASQMDEATEIMVEQWKQKINECVSLAELTKLYKDNKSSIDRLPMLAPAISAKKQSFQTAKAV
jgi:phage recombination protein Bet